MKSHHPPKLARKLLSWFAGDTYVDDLLGDMEELFDANLNSKSLYQAQWIYWKQALSLITSSVIRKRKINSVDTHRPSDTLSPSMLQNFLKVAVRNLYKHKYFSAVNVAGLAIGMSIGLLMISLYTYIRTYDNFHTNRSNIFRITIRLTEETEIIEFASAPAPLAQMLQEDYAGTEEVVRINSSFYGNVVLEKQDIPIRGYYADPNFLTVFTFEMREGHSPTALVKPNTILLTETTAYKIFNSCEVVGKSLEIKGEGNFEITGVLKDPPKNSHLKFEVLVSYSTLPDPKLIEASPTEQWTKFTNHYVYVLLRNAKERSELQRSLDEISKRAYSNSDKIKGTFQLQHLTEITPGKDLRNAIGPEWDYQGLIIFATISFLILLPACFNYTNISIARALKRSKEIGLRKTMGAIKSHIFFQFILETIIITLVSLIGAFLIFVIIRSEFQSMLVDASSLDLSLQWQTVGMFVFFALLTGLLAGIFPALNFAGLNPLQALKNQTTKRMFSGMNVRKGLTIFQFAISFGFVLSLIVFSRQYRYSLNFDFGFQKENILDVELQNVNPETFKSEFSKLSSVQNISMSSGLLGLSYSSTWSRPVGSPDSTETHQLFVDEKYIQNTELKFLSGKTFPDELWQREKYIIVNEEFLKVNQINSPREAIGKVFWVDGNELEIVGVLKNFHFASLRMPIQSFFFRMNPGQFVYANLKVSFTDTYTAIQAMEKVWGGLSDVHKFKARFFSDETAEAYDFYQSLLKIIGFLGVLAISISLLGLLGMVVYSSETKIKEVSIRKVMGASTRGIVMLLSRDYIKLMLWASMLAIPITVLLFDKMLSSMQYYSVQLTLWDVLLSFTILLLMGLATIASQTYKTASINPAEILKSE